MKLGGRTVVIVLGLAALVTSVGLVGVWLQSPPTLRSWGTVHQITIERWYARGAPVTITSPRHIRRIVSWLDAVMGMPTQKDFRQTATRMVGTWTIHADDGDFRLVLHGGFLSIRGVTYEFPAGAFDRLEAIAEPLVAGEQ